ncbi:MAG: hypothetical protein PHE29_07035 [Tissierellia bacterium]|nr:hypothetical protein [Tissierellia bacterium]
MGKVFKDKNKLIVLLGVLAVIGIILFAVGNEVASDLRITKALRDIPDYDIDRYSKYSSQYDSILPKLIFFRASLVVLILSFAYSLYKLLYLLKKEGIKNEKAV